MSNAPPTCDLLIHSATIIDGTGAPRYAGDVAIVDARIAAIGEHLDIESRSKIDASGLILAPGFIDAHTHDDRAVLSDRNMTAKASQGVTTVVTGNCGVSLAPFTGTPPPPMNLLGDESWYRFSTMREYMDAVEAAPPALNLAPMVGHTALRAATMSDVYRAATASEIDAMTDLLEEAMRSGCIGMSTGLAYPPALPAPTDEVVALASRLKAHGGLYATHMRNEDDHVVESVEETLEIGRRAEIPVVISHHKCSGRSSWGKSKETLAVIASAREHQSVNFDVYPYVASSTVLLADWIPTAERVLITWSHGSPQAMGRDFEEIRTEWGCSLEEAVERLSPAGAIYFKMDEADLRRIMTFTDAMIGSDGLPHDEFPHPRLWGTFPRVLGHYCRELGLFSLEEAVRRMTGVTASVFGLADRGEIRTGAFADLVLFDADTVLDRASFSDPKQTSAGIYQVIVNGQQIWRGGEGTGATPGRILRREAH